MIYRNMINGIAPCLWFDNEAEEAANYYVSIFKNSKTGTISRYGKEGFEFHGKPERTALAVDFTLNVQRFIELNGGPQFRFSKLFPFRFIACCRTRLINAFFQKITYGNSNQIG